MIKQPSDDFVAMIERLIDQFRAGKFIALSMITMDEKGAGVAMTHAPALRPVDIKRFKSLCRAAGEQARMDDDQA